jgi:hypothetical protein
VARGNRRWLLGLAAFVAAGPAAAQRTAAESTELALTAEQSRRLEELGWPPALPLVRGPDHDIVERRGDEPVFGALRSLHAFALVSTPAGDVRVPRAAIGFVLLNGQLIPAGAALLPLDEDAVLLRDGATVLIGRVEVEEDTIYVAGRTVRQADAALIRLLDRAADEGAAAAETAPEGDAAAPGGSDTGPATAGPPASAPSGGAGPASPGAGGGGPSPGPSFPGATGALWTGTVTGRLFVDHGSSSYSHTFEIDLRLREARYPGMPANVPVETIPLQIEAADWGETYDSLEPNGERCTGQGQGRGSRMPMAGALVVKRRNVDLTPFLGYDLPVNGQLYQLGLLPPDVEYRAPCERPDNWIVTRLIGSSTLVGRSPNVPWTPTALSDPEVRYIEGGNMQGRYETAESGRQTVVSWSLCREGAVCPPPEPLPDAAPTTPQDPCAGPRALLAHARAARQRVLDGLRQVSEDFMQLTAREASQRMTKNQLEPAFRAMLWAAIIADASTQLLEIATSSGALKASAATGRITAAQLRFLTRLDDAIEFYQEWLEFLDDPGGWGTSKVLGGAQEAVLGEENSAQVGDLAAFALDMVAYGLLLGDLAGQGDSSQTLAYIEANLGRFGPLIPPESLNEARQYVEASQMWADTIRTMARVTAQGGRLAFEAEDMALNIAVQESRIDGC